MHDIETLEYSLLLLEICEKWYKYGSLCFGQSDWMATHTEECREVRIEEAVVILTGKEEGQD